ncbi:unnamed protein product [Rotaria magnacalcarata]
MSSMSVIEMEIFSISMINVDRRVKRPSRRKRQSSKVSTLVVYLVKIEETQVLIGRSGSEVTRCRQKLVKHIIAQCTLAQTADQISITVLDAIKWIDLSWENVTENTIRNGFRAAGFIHSSSTSSSSMMNMDNIIETDIESNNSDNPLQQLELLLISSY